MTQVNQIYEDLIFRDAQATPGLKRVSDRVTGIAGAVGRLKAMFGGVGGAVGLAGMFGVASAVAGVGNLYERVRRLRAVTGETAADVHALTDAFELTGASDQVADRTITRLAALSQRARGAGEEAGKLRTRLRGVGVDLKGNVTDSLLSMSTAVRSGRLGVAEMAKTFKIPLSQAAQLMGTLRQGPERLRAIISETKAGADIVDDAALASFEKMQRGKLELADAWQGLVGTLYKQMLPGVTRLVNGLREGLEAVQPIAESIGRFLSTHMNLVVAAAKAYLGYMVAARAVALSGGNLGGILKGQFGGLLQFRRGAQSAAYINRAQGLSNLGAGLGAAGQQAAIRMQYAGRGGGLAGAGGSIAQILGGWAPSLGKLASSTVSIRALGMLVGRLGVVGLGVALAVKGFQVLKNDIGGHRSRISQVLADIAKKFEGIGKVVSPVAKLLEKAFGSYMMLVVRYWLTVLEYWLKGINLVLTVVKAIAYILGSIVSSPIWSARNPGTMIKNAWNRASESADRMTGGGNKSRSSGAGASPDSPYMDFRGSKFTIENSFAEGFDIGRVSTVITDGIADAGQRRVMSSVSPLFAVRGRG